MAGIVNGTANLENARHFMDFIVSVAFQKLIALNQIMYPVHPDVELPDVFMRVKRARSIVTLSEEQIAGSFDRWLKEWEAVMQ